MKMRARTTKSSSRTSTRPDSPIDRAKAKILANMTAAPDRNWTFAELLAESGEDTITTAMAISRLVFRGLVDHPAAGVNRLPVRCRTETATANRVRLTADASSTTTRAGQPYLAALLCLSSDESTGDPAPDELRRGTVRYVTSRR